MDASVDDLWFNTLDTFSLCRGGKNGPHHPSQLFAIHRYVKPKESFLDWGCGSGTTYEALITQPNLSIENHVFLELQYKGVDVIKKNIDWCRRNFIEGKKYFDYNPTLNKIDQPDKSFDVVYSRHVVDHLPSFESGLDEQCRVAKRLVIIVLWRKLLDDKDEIKHIREKGKLYEREYTNQYSRKTVMEAIKKKTDWKLISLTEQVGEQDVVIVLEREVKDK